ncbi:MAG: surE [Chlamydiia bacterium]|nr:surE [Chlamydiia bacterium]
MKVKPNILITNDDSIHAPGIKHLWNACREHAHVTIVAPATEQSGVGLGTTLRNSLSVAKVAWPEETPAYSVTGTPADCVKIGLNVIMETPPDLIISGINRGTNHGRTLLYSGTVGGVIEGIFRGIPGIAFSSFDFFDTEYECFEPYIPKIIDYSLKHPLPSGTLLNVNFPKKSSLASNGLYGIKLTRQGRQYWRESSHQVELENCYRFISQLADFEEHEESDTFWLSQGYITVSPVHVDDLTDRHYIQAQKEHFETFFVPS